MAMKFVLQQKDTSDGSKGDQNGSIDQEPGTSADKTSKKDKSDFIKLRVVGQVCTRQTQDRNNIYCRQYFHLLLDPGR